ncbi:uncharacterized protein G2W53_007823 [Senna tora]|uniref:Uncharacterized protein n=1 Tax=Senna tora TaxID=362788 RepID=A0A835CF96_9FABA|nr:uncharacterized protein G2W53_007823 [Senna tora]
MTWPTHTAESTLICKVVSNICRYYALSRPTKANVEDETDFKWGNKRGDGVKNKEVQFYESLLIRVWSIFCMIVSTFTKQVILKLPLTGIGDDGVGDSFLSSLEDFLLQAVLAHILDESAMIDSLSSSFIEVIMDIDNPFISRNYCDEGPIRAHHIRNISKFEGSLDVPALERIICERTRAMSRSLAPSCPRMNSPEMPPVIFFTALSWEYASMDMGSLVEYLLKSPSFRPIHARRFLMVRSMFFPRSIDFPTIFPSKSEKERFA